VRAKDTYFAAQFKRLAVRRGVKRAIIAVAHSLLVVIYHLLRDGTLYTELGGTFFEQHDREATAQRSIRRLERLGYTVSLTPV
jgi:hypothetical protein